MPLTGKKAETFGGMYRRHRSAKMIAKEAWYANEREKRSRPDGEVESQGRKRVR